MEFIGFGVGMMGGLMLGSRLFMLDVTDELTNDLSHLDQKADADDNIPEPDTHPGKGVPPDVMAMLPFMPQWISQPDFEQCSWLNDSLAWMWPNMSRAVHKMVMDMVNPMVADLLKAHGPLLEALTIECFDLGPEPPSLKGVKVSETRDDEVIIEAPIMWGSALKIHASAKVRVGPASIYVPVKVENVAIRSTARFTFRPLVETIPCIGGLNICLVDSPYVDGVVKAITDWDVLVIPFVHSAVCIAARKALEGICVYPNSYTVPIMPNYGLPKPLYGFLEIHLDKATNLKGSSDLLGKGDPFVRMSMVHYDRKGKIIKQGAFHQSRVRHNTHNPTFNQDFRILVEDVGPNWALLFEVLDHDFLASHDLLCVYNLVLDDAEDAEHAFLREPLKEHEMTLALDPPPSDGGPLDMGKLKKLANPVAGIRDATKAHDDFGALHLTTQYVPFNRPDDDEAQGEEDAVKAMERAQRRETPNKVNSSMKGVLIVHVMRCSDLPLIGGTTDSYVELKFTDPEGADPDFRWTDLVTNDPAPRFRQKFDFVYVSATSELVFTVYDKTGLFDVSNLVKLHHKKDTVIGKVRIKVQDVVRASRIKDDFPLQDAHSGNLHATLEWIPVEKYE